MSERDERCAEFLTKKNSLSEEMSTLQVNYLTISLFDHSILIIKACWLIKSFLHRL